MNVASAVSFVWNTKPDFPSAAASDQAAVSDQAGDNNDWAEKALDDDELEA